MPCSTSNGKYIQSCATLTLDSVNDESGKADGCDFTVTLPQNPNFHDKTAALVQVLAVRHSGYLSTNTHTDGFIPSQRFDPVTVGVEVNGIGPKNAYHCGHPTNIIGIGANQSGGSHAIIQQGYSLDYYRNANNVIQYTGLDAAGNAAPGANFQVGDMFKIYDLGNIDSSQSYGYASGMVMAVNAGAVTQWSFLIHSDDTSYVTPKPVYLATGYKYKFAPGLPQTATNFATVPVSGAGTGLIVTATTGNIIMSVKDDTGPLHKPGGWSSQANVLEEGVLCDIPFGKRLNVRLVNMCKPAATRAQGDPATMSFKTLKLMDQASPTQVVLRIVMLDNSDLL